MLKQTHFRALFFFLILLLLTALLPLSVPAIGETPTDYDSYYAEGAKISWDAFNRHTGDTHTEEDKALFKKNATSSAGAFGEGYLSDICRLHPRFFNETARGTEVGLGMSCEEAARIILSSDGYAEFVSVGGAECSGCDFDVFPYRAEVYSILSDRKIRYAERLKMIGEKFSVSPSVLTDSEWGEVLSSLEYLDALSCERFACYSSDISESIWECELERALAYFVYRHSSDAKNYAEFRTGLGFAMFCERLLSSVAKAEGVGNFADFTDLARVISEEIEYSANNTDILRSEIEFAMQ